MALEYHFETRSIVILLCSLLLLLALVFTLGLVTGLSMHQPDSATHPQPDALETGGKTRQDSSTKESRGEAFAPSESSLEAELKPLRPDFADITPEREKPGISQPKTD